MKSVVVSRQSVVTALLYFKRDEWLTPLFEDRVFVCWGVHVCLRPAGACGRGGAGRVYDAAAVMRGQRGALVMVGPGRSRGGGPSSLAHLCKRDVKVSLLVFDTVISTTLEGHQNLRLGIVVVIVVSFRRRESDCDENSTNKRV